MEKQSKIYVAGHKGLVGSALVRKLKLEGFDNLLVSKSSQTDLRNQESVNHFFEQENPEYIFMAAAKVGGILANSNYQAEFIYDNLMIQSNVIHAAWKFGVKKLLFLASSCIYPKFAEQPIRETELLKGLLESTNESYAIAKIAGIKMCEAYSKQYGCNFISVMPTNLYGPNDNYDLQNSHVLPALLRKFHEAKLNKLPAVTLWGTGSPKRDFLHVDDLAAACFFLMQDWDKADLINIGSGSEISITQLALLIKDVIGYQGEIKFDHTKPDGTPRKLLDNSKLNSLGWKPSIELNSGILSAYEDFKNRFYK